MSVALICVSAFSVPLPCGCYSIQTLTSGRAISPTSFFFFKIVLAVLIPSPFNINFRISFFTSTKKSCWDFDKNFIKTTNQFGRSGILTISHCKKQHLQKQIWLLAFVAFDSAKATSLHLHRPLIIFISILQFSAYRFHKY